MEQGLTFGTKGEVLFLFGAIHGNHDPNGIFVFLYTHAASLFEVMTKKEVNQKDSHPLCFKE